MNTTIDLNVYLAALSPWDLSLKIGDGTYGVRPITLGDSAAIDLILEGKQPDIEIVKKIVAGLFEQPAPDIAALSGEAVMAILLSVTRYLGERAKKNGVPLAEAIYGKATASADAPTTPPLNPSGK